MTPIQHARWSAKLWIVLAAVSMVLDWAVWENDLSAASLLAIATAAFATGRLVGLREARKETSPDGRTGPPGPDN